MMEFLLDTANLEEIRKCIDTYPITGITSNPSILKAEGKIDIFAHMKEIRRLIGMERTLHVQVIAKDCAGILKDADLIRRNIDENVYIKIPTNEEGLKAMQELKKQKAKVTATAIYYRIQGFMAIACGAEYIAPYFNRMENLDEDSQDIISDFRSMIDSSNSQTKILAASFKNVSQANKALLSGAHSVTIQPQTLHAGFNNFMVTKAIDDFASDWQKIQQRDTLIEE